MRFPVVRPPTRAVAFGVALVFGPGFAACGDDPGSPATTARNTETSAVIDAGDAGSYAPKLDPAAFVDRIDNPYLPFVPGAHWVYEGVSDGQVEHIDVRVTDERRMIMGISAVVVRDTASVHGAVVEDTRDWYAQDADGNVWYLGEDTGEYENGAVVSTAGSWEAGVDGAYPGIVMEAHPNVGDAYRQEYLPGEAEDLAQVARLGVSESVPYASYDDLLVTREWSPLEPQVVEEKYYAAGVGSVLEVTTRGGDERIELHSYTPGSTG